ncbi:type II toxin-antitoxin system ParD family antitoxin [Bartonella sp. DGB2]|uniref:ribbon-helix-helix domain-containing protein n=1 Tax=Bartonella sp. DGB2 TaxID=3388426 RepID=UPI00398FB4D8
MASSLNISLTDELRAFVDSHAGDGTLYATPSEFVRAVLREKKMVLEAAKIRDGLMRGYQDASNGRTIPYTGSFG